MPPQNTAEPFLAQPWRRSAQKTLRRPATSMPKNNPFILSCSAKVENHACGIFDKRSSFAGSSSSPHMHQSRRCPDDEDIDEILSRYKPNEIVTRRKPQTHAQLRTDHVTTGYEHKTAKPTFVSKYYVDHELCEVPAASIPQYLTFWSKQKARAAEAQRKNHP